MLMKNQIFYPFEKYTNKAINFILFKKYTNKAILHIMIKERNTIVHCNFIIYSISNI